jgi:hypothetical protein
LAWKIVKVYKLFQNRKWLKADLNNVEFGFTIKLHSQ